MMKKILFTLLFSLLFVVPALASLKYAEEINALREQKKEYIEISSHKYNAIRLHNHYMERISDQLESLENTLSFELSADELIGKSETYQKLAKLYNTQVKVTNGLQQIELLESSLPYEFDHALEELREFPELLQGFREDKVKVLERINALKAELIEIRDQTQESILDWLKWQLDADLSSYAASLEDAHKNLLLSKSMDQVINGTILIKLDFFRSISKGDLQRAADLLIGLQWIKAKVPLFFMGKITQEKRLEDFDLMNRTLENAEIQMTQTLRKITEAGYLRSEDEKSLLGDLFDWFSGGRRTNAKERSDKDIKKESKIEPTRNWGTDIKTVTWDTPWDSGRARLETTRSEKEIVEKLIISATRKNSPHDEPMADIEKQRKVLIKNRNTRPGETVNVEITHVHRFSGPEKVGKDHSELVTSHFKGHNPNRRYEAEGYLGNLHKDVSSAQKESPEDAAELEHLKKEVEDFNSTRKEYEDRLAFEAKEAAKLRKRVLEFEKNIQSLEFNDDFTLPSISHLDREKKIKELGRMMADLGLGVAAGTPYDFADFISALALDESLLGDKLDLNGKILRGVALVLPFVSVGILTQSSKAVTKIIEISKNNGISSEVLSGMKSLYQYFPENFKDIIGNEHGGLNLQIFQEFNKALKTSDEVGSLLGNKYVRELPELEGTFKAAFDGNIFQGSYEPGEILFQAQSIEQLQPGRWFLPIKPIDVQHAEDLTNIAKWDKIAGKVKVFKVKERVSGYAGKISGGSGHQFFIPKDVPLEDILEEILEIKF